MLYNSDPYKNDCYPIMLNACCCNPCEIITPILWITCICWLCPCAIAHQVKVNKYNKHREEQAYQTTNNNTVPTATVTPVPQLPYK